MNLELPWTRCSQVDPADDCSTIHSIKVLTWNILSQTCVHYHESYCHREPGKYVLSAQHRRQRVAQTLAEYDADIVCLQECDFTDDMIHGSITSGSDDASMLDWLKHQLGYEVGGSCSDDEKNGGQGVIILYKRSKMQVIRSTVIQYDEVCQLPRTTGQGAVVLTFRIHPEMYIVLGGTHLYWDPTVMETVHIPQAHALLSCVREHQNQCACHGKRIPPCVILGDLNDTAGDGYGPCRVLGTDAGNVSAMHECGCYSSNIPTTVTPWFTGCLDYIWYSRDDSVCRVVGHSRMPDCMYLPNATWPSDHIPVGCILCYL